jgi:hypothetical protein
LAVLGRGEASSLLELFGEKEVGLKLKRLGNFVKFSGIQKQLYGLLIF